MKRLITRLLIAVLLVLALLLAAGGLLLGTEAGTTWLVGQVQRLAPGVVRVQRCDGHFFGHLELHGVGLSLETMTVSIDRMVLDWSPRRLFSGAFIVNELSASAVRYAGEPAEEVPPPEPLQWPIELPAISPPLRIELRSVALADVEIISAPGAAPLQIDRAELVGHWGEQGIVLEHLVSAGPAHGLRVEGQVDPLDDYALVLNNELALLSEGEPQYLLAGGIEGDTARLTLAQQLSGAVRLGLDATLDQPLAAPAWRALLQLQALPGELLAEPLAMTLQGELEATGDLNEAQLAGQLSSASESVDLDGLGLQLALGVDLQRQHLTLTELELTQDQRPLNVRLAGEASSEQLDLRADWRALQWPLVRAPVLQLTEGTLSLQGAPADYRLALVTAVASPAQAAGEWRLLGTGDQQRFTLDSLTGRLLGGTLGAAGDLAWTPEVSWNLTVDADQLRPGEPLSNPQAMLHFELASEGRILDGGPQAEVVLQSLAGTLNGQPLTGRGRLSYTTDRLEIDQLMIVNADAKLQADGVLGAQSDLSWTLLIPSFGRFVADASGRLASEGRLSGPQQQPSIVGTIDADSVRLTGLHLDRLDADVDVDLQDRRRSRVAVSGRTLVAGGTAIDRLDLAVDGYLREHRVTLRASQPRGAVNLVAAGGYDEDWIGELSRLDLDSEALGRWRLQQSVALELGPERAESERLCLSRASALLCAAGAWRKQGDARGQFALTAVPLDWFQSFLPEQIKALSGMLDARGEFSQAGELRAEATVTVSPGELRFLGAGDDVRIPHSGVDLTLAAADQGASGELRAGAAGSRLLAEIELPDVLAVDDPERARLAAKLRLDVPRMDIVPLLAPSISRIEGKARADFTVSGELGKPWLDGSGRLRLAVLDLVELGLALTETRLDLGVTNNTLTLDGRSLSGGLLKLKGGVLLDADRDWPFTLSLTGEDFVALNLPNLLVLISPDLKLQRSDGAIALGGQLAIPRAELLIRDLPAGSRSASGDVVIVRPDGVLEEAEETTPVTTDITVTLGDKVHVAALGLDAFLRGELALRAPPGEALRATGDLRMDEGIFRAYGQQLEIERGLFTFAKSPVDNPGVNVRAVRTIGDVVVGVNALGTAQEILVTTFSSPGMSENDRISYLVTGKPAREGARLSLDRQLSKNLSVGVAFDTHTGERAFLTRYRLHRTLHTEVSSSARSSTLDLFYTIERR